MRRAIFPGTFDPFTIGHSSVVSRALTFIDEIVIGIGINENKNTYFPLEKREQMIRDYYRNEPRIIVQSYDCLTIDFARQVDASLIIRGIRTVKDFEYEETIADTRCSDCKHAKQCTKQDHGSCSSPSRNLPASVPPPCANCCNTART